MEKAFRYDMQTAVVQTNKGLVHGYEYDGVVVFKGIPYAKARRFHDPEPVEPWDGILETVGAGNICPNMEGEMLANDLGGAHRIGVQNENCQNLNVWTPACDQGKRPVMVWLHGGAFTMGSSLENVSYEGHSASKYGQIVFVSINHRLNILGYCDLSEFGEEYANSGNAGTSDMVAALQWVHDNIASFGGDPENVTIFGQSGGGMKVTALIQTPAADGRFPQRVDHERRAGWSTVHCVGSGRKMGEMLLEKAGVSSVKRAGKPCPIPSWQKRFKRCAPAAPPKDQQRGNAVPEWVLRRRSPGSPLPQGDGPHPTAHRFHLQRIQRVWAEGL